MQMSSLLIGGGELTARFYGSPVHRSGGKVKIDGVQWVFVGAVLPASKEVVVLARAAWGSS
jgi:hypothetical protein